MSEWTLNMLTASALVGERLTVAQLSPEAVVAKAALFAQSAEALRAWGLAADSPVTAWFVPGRIEVLGKHTDYAGGRSLTAAAERGFCCVAVPRDDTTIRIFSAENSQTTEFPLAPDLTPSPGHWSNYPMTVARRVARNFPGDLRGADIAFTSDLPTAAGMSSSSALVIAIFLMLSDVNQLCYRDDYRQNIDSPLDLAGYMATIENGLNFRSLAGDHGVGTFGGSEDHTAILCSQASRLGQFSYCPVRHERWVTLPDEYLFAIASSGVVAEKTGSAMEKYNRASQLATAAAEVWRNATSREDAHLAAAIASSSAATGQIRDVLQHCDPPHFQAAELLCRFEHFFAESEEIIPAVTSRLDEQSIIPLGQLVDRSQSLGTELLGNQVPETICLAKAARELGAAAASAFGAGFGGSVWALVRVNRAEAFLDSWQERYRSVFPGRTENSAFFTTFAGPAAFRLSEA